MNNFARTQTSLMLMACACAYAPSWVSAQDAGARQQNLEKEIGRHKTDPKVSPVGTPNAPSPVADQPHAKIFVKQFKITGLTLLTEAQAQAALETRMNQELTFAELQAAAQVISDLYISKGYLAAAVIPEQDVTDGVVEIRIVEAKVGAVLVQAAESEKSYRLQDHVAQGFITRGNETGQFLSLDQLNRSQSLINELPGVKAQVTLKKSQEDGASDIKVAIQDQGLWMARAELSNNGSLSTGQLQNTWGFNLNNPSGIGDAINLDLALSKGSTFATAKYWVPAGYDGWRVAPGIAALSYQSLSNFSSTVSKGNADVAGLYATYALQRGGMDSHTVNLSVENKRYQNFSNDSETSDYGIVKINVGLSGALQSHKNFISYAINAGLGSLDIKNQGQKEEDQSPTGLQTKGGFAKLGINLAFMTELPLTNTSARLSLNGQLASKNLNSSEQMYLGGPDGVRAYPVAQGGGSQGLVASAEITHLVATGLQLGVFLDAGVIQQYKFKWSPELQGRTKADNTYSLKAAGFTAKYVWSDVLLQAALAYRLGQNPLHNSTGQQLNVDNAYRHVQAWVKATYAFN